MQAHTIESVADILNSGRSKVYELIGKGEIKAKKRGRFTIILDEDLNAYLRNLPDAVEAGAIRAATDENPPPRRASELAPDTCSDLSQLKREAGVAAVPTPPPRRDPGRTKPPRQIKREAA
jgi:excisionase family DNA binding protein